MRWFRTNLLGRIPGWARTPRTVGPWKPLEIIRADEDRSTAVLDAFVHASCDGDGGRVDAALRFADAARLGRGRRRAAVLVCLGRETPFEVERRRTTA